VIEVKQLSDSEPMVFQAMVSDEGGETQHRVTMSQADFQRLSSGTASAEVIVEAAFVFLLEREPKEAILSQFDITVISRYFPDFDQAISRYLP